MTHLLILSFLQLIFFILFQFKIDKTKNLPIENSGKNNGVWGKISFDRGNCETIEVKMYLIQ